MIGLTEIGSILGAILLIAGIYLLATKKENKMKLLSGIICTVVGGLFLLFVLFLL